MPLGASRAGLMSVGEDAIPDSAVARYDPRQESTGSVSSISDQIGGNDLTGSGSVVDDGINGVQSFDTDDDENWDISQSDFTVERDWAINFVVELPATATNNMLLGNNDDDNELVYWQDDDSGNWNVRWGDDGSVETGSSSTTNPFVGTFRAFGSSGGETLINNSTDIDATNNDGVDDLLGFSLGSRADGDLQIDAKFGEVVIYDNPSESDLEDEVERLADDYGISL